MNTFSGATLCASLDRSALLQDWLDQNLSISLARGLTTEADMRSQFAAFVEVFLEALHAADSFDAGRPEWARMHAFLDEMSSYRARLGFTPVETATFVLSLNSRYTNSCVAIAVTWPNWQRLREFEARQSLTGQSPIVF